MRESNWGTVATISEASPSPWTLLGSCSALDIFLLGLVLGFPQNAWVWCFGFLTLFFSPTKHESPVPFWSKPPPPSSQFEASVRRFSRRRGSCCASWAQRRPAGHPALGSHPLAARRLLFEQALPVGGFGTCECLSPGFNGNLSPLDIFAHVSRWQKHMQECALEKKNRRVLLFLSSFFVGGRGIRFFLFFLGLFFSTRAGPLVGWLVGCLVGWWLVS